MIKPTRQFIKKLTLCAKTNQLGILLLTNQWFPAPHPVQQLIATTTRDELATYIPLYVLEKIMRGTRFGELTQVERSMLISSSDRITFQPTLTPRPIRDRRPSTTYGDGYQARVVRAAPRASGMIYLTR